MVRCILSVAAAINVAATARPAGGQSAQAASGSELIDVVYHDWRPTKPLAGAAAGVLRVEQLAAPINWRFGGNQRVTLDVGGGGAFSRVTIKSGDSVRVLELKGPTDIRTLLTISLFDNNVALFVGGTIPTGLTKLNSTQLAALSILAAPSVRAPVAAFGGGAAGSGGAAVTFPFRKWSITAGTGYERRFRYTPFSELAVDVPVDAIIAPGSLLTFSGGIDGELAGTAIAIGGSIRQFYADTFAVTREKRTVRSVYRLGPLTDLSLRVQPALRFGRDVVFSAALQHRAPYEILNRGQVSGSDASTKNASVAGTLLRLGGWRLTGGAGAVSYSGIKTDSTLMTAAFRELSATVGLAVPLSDSEMILSTAFATGSMTIGQRESVPMRRVSVRLQIQSF
jgi:hypothetical protein